MLILVYCLCHLLQGGFVLCRLFRKPEETISGLISHDLENNLIPTKSSPGSLVHGADELEGEYATPLDQASPVSDLLEELQPMPDTIGKQSGDNRLADVSHYSISYSVKLEESHSNSNTTSDTGNHEGARAGEQVSSYAYQYFCS